MTEEAGAIVLSEVTNADYFAVTGVETGLDSVQEIRLVILDVSANCQGAEVGQLNHSSKGGIYE